jgi:hypothetical protein
MIKKYKQYIKETIDYSEVDPWGEEEILKNYGVIIINFQMII